MTYYSRVMYPINGYLEDTQKVGNIIKLLKNYTREDKPEILLKDYTDENYPEDWRLLVCLIENRLYNACWENEWKKRNGLVESIIRIILFEALDGERVIYKDNGINKYIILWRAINRIEGGIIEVCIDSAVETVDTESSYKWHHYEDGSTQYVGVDDRACFTINFPSKK